MGQKIHPVGFRLGVTKDYQSKWFASSLIYPNLIFEDYLIRNTLFKTFTNGLISNIEIQRKFDDQIQLAIYSTKPTAFLSYYNNELKNLSDFLVKKVQKNRKFNFQKVSPYDPNIKNLYSLNPKFTVKVFELSTPDSNASFIAGSLTGELQKRVAFRRAMKRAIRRARRAKVRGVKIQISGRLNGAEIARSEWGREGQIPLHTIRAEIDYCHRTAKTIYGILGVKVWIFKR